MVTLGNNTGKNSTGINTQSGQVTANLKHTLSKFNQSTLKQVLSQEIDVVMIQSKNLSTDDNTFAPLRVG